MYCIRVSRLRKLRRTEDEQLVDGENYVNRLRIQHAKVFKNLNTSWAELKKDGEGSQGIDTRSLSDVNIAQTLNFQVSGDFNIYLQL